MVKKVSTVFCYLIVAVGSAALCQEGFSNYNPRECSEDDKIDLLYQKLERAIANDSKAIVQMKRKFFPVASNHIQERQIFYLHVCVRDQCMSSESSTKISNENNSIIHCWNKWSDSALLTLISIDQLMVFKFWHTCLVRLHWFT